MGYEYEEANLQVGSAEFNNALEKAWVSKERLGCKCSSTNPPMYVAKVSGHFIVKRMPGTGHLHHPDCLSYMPPAGVSGLGQVLDSAIQHSEEDNQTLLRLDFSLSQSGKRPPMPPPSSEGATEAVSAPRKLTLTGLLHYLWHEADLVKWMPRFEGKRSWGVIHNAITFAADGIVAKGNPLAERLYIPKPFRMDHKAELESQRRAAFARLQNAKTSTKQLGMVIAEYKAHAPTQRGAKFVFKHIPGCGFFADQDLTDRFERVFQDAIDLVDIVDDAHLIVMATYSIARAGYPELNTIAAMPVSRNWVPFENLNDLTLFDQIAQEGRPFIRPLRFNLPKSEMVASALLIDTVPPVACYIGPHLPEGIDEDYPSWLWTADCNFPALPRSEKQEYNDMLDKQQAIANRQRG